MARFLKSAGNTLAAIIMLALASYFPATYFIARHRHEEAQKWEIRRCDVLCGIKRGSGVRGGSTYSTTLTYRVKPKIERPAPEPTGENEPPEADKIEKRNQNSANKNSKPSLDGKVKELREKREKLQAEIDKSKEESDKFWERMRQYQEEEKKYWVSYHNYGIYHLNGWHYWLDAGKSDFCSKAPSSGGGSPWFEAECYLNPEDQREAALYRGFELGWFLGILLILNFVILFGLIYLLFRGFFKSVRGT